MDTQTLTITDALNSLNRGDITPQNLAEACSRQINRLNPTLNAYITVIPPEDALKAQYPAGTSPLTKTLRNVPIAVKDLFDVEGIRTTIGSRFFADHIAEHDAFVVDKLKQSGAIINGKTNTHEIALGITGNNPHYGTARNPWDTQRIPGGSSSGSAIAVATGMALGALGTDTGGSIRIPASLCGVVGFKPTRGRVSTRGVFPLSWNLDHVGPLTKCVKDAAVILQVISVYDPIDPFSIRMLTGDYLGHLVDDMEGRKIALGTGEFIETSDPEVLNAVREAAKVFESMGCRVEKVNVDWMRDAALANKTMTQADGAAVHRERLEEHPDWFGEDIRRRLEDGAKTTSTEYILARRTQSEVRKRCELFFESYDLLLTPTTPIAAPTIEGHDAVEQAGRLTRFTAPFNLTGLPALSVPSGFTKEGLPIGLQIVSRAWGDAKALNAGHAFEQATDWHKKFPVI
ncbi:MAG: Asp-tRNA(Asn)/Glu-tRNA(Gln) amidotransferase subunit GatA [Anaerolineales bacterium]|nr:MAG: Asp-tRNA(Asn)/Glu-tRNA(Gln) amidotransferase subunit GatA [Anaerolineales bacterium]